MFHKGSDVQWLGEQVSWLFSSVNWKDVNETRLDPFSGMMVLLVDVPSWWAHLWRLGNVDSSSIVLKEFAVDSRSGGFDLHTMLLHLLEEVHQDDGNAQALR